MLLIETFSAAQALVEDVVNKHNIKTYEDFSCPKMRALAKALGYFEE